MYLLSIYLFIYYIIKYLFIILYYLLYFNKEYEGLRKILHIQLL